MRLSIKEKKILGCVEMQANISIPQIQKMTGYREHSIRYVLHKLTANSIIKFVPFIDVYPLGFQDYAIYFSLSPDKIKTKQKLIDFLIQSSFVSWLSELGGEYQYVMAIYAKNAADFLSFINSLASRFGDIIFDKSISIRVTYHQFNRKYLQSGGKNTISSCTFGDSERRFVLDALDHKILISLACGSFGSRAEISRALNVPLSTINVRIKRLENQKIITGYSYAVNFEKIGMHMFEVLIYAKGMDQGLGNNLYQFARSHPSIVHFLQCIGAWDYEIGIEVESPEAIVPIIQELYQAFGSRILTVKILPLFRHLKISYYPFI